MLTFIVAVHDRQLDAFMRPFTAQAIGQAIRSFRDETNRKDSEIHAHPEDYQLYQLGTFDDQHGEIVALKKPELLAIASNLIER